MTVERISSYKLVKTKSIKVLNQTQHVVIVTPCSISLAIRQSPYTKGHITHHGKPPRIKGKHKW